MDIVETKEETNIVKKDFICNTLEKLLNHESTNDNKLYDVKIRHLYSNEPFLTRIISSLKEMKSLKKKILITPEMGNQRYEKRSIWLCYEISIRARCSCCNNFCSKDKLLKVTNPITAENVLICPSCAYKYEYSNNTDACMNCSNRTCKLNIKDFMDIINVREEQKRILKGIKDNMKTNCKINLNGKNKKKKKKNKKRKK